MTLTPSCNQASVDAVDKFIPPLTSDSSQLAILSLRAPGSQKVRQASLQVRGLSHPHLESAAIESYLADMGEHAKVGGGGGKPDVACKCSKYFRAAITNLRMPHVPNSTYLMKKAMVKSVRSRSLYIS